MDQFMISHFGSAAVAAIGNGNQVMNVVIIVLTTMSTAATILLTQHIGAGRVGKECSEIVTVAVTVSAVFSFLVGLFLLLEPELVFQLLRTPEDAFDGACLYTRIVGGTVLLQGLYIQLCAVLRSYTLLKEVVVLSVSMNLLNVVGNAILINGFFGFPQMGVAGAAVATIIGQFCGCALAIYFNHKKNTDITLSIKGFRPDWSLIGEIYAIGLPSVIMVGIGSVMTFLMNKILITYHSAHETAATAFGVYFKLNSFIFMPVFGMNNGIIPIVAYNYGAQNRRRMMETIKRGTLYASCIMVAGTILFQAIPGPLLSIFDATDTMMAVGIPALRIISLSFCMAGACIALGSSFQALGKSLYSMVTSIVRQLVFLVPIAYVLARYGASVGNDDLVWWCYPIAEIASLLLTLCFFRHVYKTMIAQIPEGRA